MNIQTILLTFILPLIFSLTAIYLIVDRFLKHWNQQKSLDGLKENQKLIFPLKIQAYERLILFLERINPHQLVLREAHPGLSLDTFHYNLVKTIRDEFEHNLSQQLYVSAGLWEMVKGAKEEVVQIIHNASLDTPRDSDSAILAGKIFEIVAQNKMMTWQNALKKLHDEFTRLSEL